MPDLNKTLQMVSLLTLEHWLIHGALFVNIRGSTKNGGVMIDDRSGVVWGHCSDSRQPHVCLLVCRYLKMEVQSHIKFP